MTEAVNDDVTLRCRIVQRQGRRYLIEADLGQAWFNRSEFEFVGLPVLKGRAVIEVSDRVATARGIW